METPSKFFKGKNSWEEENQFENKILKEFEKTSSVTEESLVKKCERNFLGDLVQACVWLDAKLPIH